jgi:hypothetical protein
MDSSIRLAPDPERASFWQFGGTSNQVYKKILNPDQYADTHFSDRSTFLLCDLF